MTSPPSGLTNAQIQQLWADCPSAQVREMMREIYRLRRLVKRMDTFLTTARRYRFQTSDPTPANLMYGLCAAIAQEPAITEPNALVQVVAQPQQRRGGRSLSRPSVCTQISEPPTLSLPPIDGIASREKLFTWRLSPEPGRRSAAWQTSSYEVFARARDAVEARALVAQRFNGSCKGRSPWSVRSLVRCQLSAEATYDRVEIASVVYP